MSDDSQSQTSAATPRYQVKLSSYFVAILVAALLTAWWIDRSQLKKQIPGPKVSIARSYAIKNVPVDQIATQVNEIYNDDCALPYVASNMLVVQAEQEKHDQISNVIRLLDVSSSDTKTKAENNLLPSSQ